MEFSRGKKAGKFLRKLWKKKYGRVLIAGMGALVVGGTVYALVLPAITMTKDPSCGKEEHTHTADCYEKQLVCTQEETASDGSGQEVLACPLKVHVHTKSCYNKDGEPVCGYADYVIHTHDENCRDSSGNLVCTLPEVEEHKHGDGCYKEEKTLICGQEESKGHQHTDSCYEEKWTGNYTCGQEEGEAHTHTDACKEMEKVLTCGKEESEGHQHSDACYQTEKVLTCKKPEIISHTHTEKCCAAPKDHTHTESCYDEQGLLICGGLTCDKTEVLAHQHDKNCFSSGGHTHTDACYEDVLVCGKEEHTHTDACYEKGETKNLNDLSEEDRAQVEAVIALIDGLPEYDAFGEKLDAYDADGDEEGYAAYYDAIVGQAKEAYDAYDALGEELQAYVSNADRLMQYKKLWEEEDGDAAEEENASGNDTTAEESGEEITKTYEDEDFIVTATYGQKANIPEEAKLKAKMITQESDAETYEKREKELKETMGNDAATVTALFKIGFYVDGEEIEPEDTVKITIQLLDEEGLPEGKSMTVVHFMDESTEVLESTKVKDGSMTFETESFSTYAVTEDRSVTVYQVNSYGGGGEASKYGTILVYGGDTNKTLKSIEKSTMNTTMLFSTWKCVIVEYKSGKYVVKSVLTDEASRQEETIPAKGFMLLMFNEDAKSVAINEGDIVTTTVELTTSKKNYKADGYGVVTFASSTKEEKDNSSKLQTVKAADTSKLINVNLYDYDEDINTNYNTNSNYPGFQLPSDPDKGGGTPSVVTNIDRYSKWSFNYGDNITADGGKDGVTGDTTAINKSNGTDPVSGALQSKLNSSGDPVLNTRESLGYLFSDSGTGVTKKNSGNINGLFQYDATTGEYWYDSRENHAQFNESDDTFTLYKQKITSNFIMYPFGNFLPFNDIKTQCQQSSLIDHDYIAGIANSAYAKGNVKWYQRYDLLATVLDNFNTAMGSNWTAKDAVNAYFQKAEINRTFTNDELTDIYTIDYDEPTDFFFGMEMDMTFFQPHNGITGPNNNQDMVYKFHGDDDVMVYIDGTLFLDLSGIHRHVAGEINFVNGTVTYYTLNSATGEADHLSKTVSFKDILGENNDDLVAVQNGDTTIYRFKDYSVHDFKFYYMERGSGSGVCKMNFNMPLLKQNSISVGKEVTTDEDTKVIGDPDYQFQILQANEDGKKTETLFIPVGTEYEIYEGDYDTGVKGTVGENGIFKLKAGQSAVFSGIDENKGKYYVRELLEKDFEGQYGKVTVSGTEATTNLNPNLSSEGSFVGKESDVKDVSDGSTKFTFTNQISTNKLGKLKIEKKVDPENSPAEDTEFKFEVKLDGELIEQGTHYTVYTLNAEGDIIKTDDKEVDNDGIITLKRNQAALIENIIAGIDYEVTEQNPDGEYYVISEIDDGKGEPTQTTGTQATQATGRIPVFTDSDSTTGAASVTVIMTNSNSDISVSIPVKKMITNPDGQQHTYTFDMVQIDEKTGNDVEEGYKGGLTVTFEDGDTSGTANGTFIIPYENSSLTENETVFYYMLTEKTEVPEEEKGADFDKSKYVIKITVNKAEDGKLTIDKSKIVYWKNENGTENETVWWTGDGTPLYANNKENPPTFKNVILQDLTIAKVVDGKNNSSENPSDDNSQSEHSFHFELLLQSGGETGLNVDGTYNCIITSLEASSNVQTATLVIEDGKIKSYQVVEGGESQEYITLTDGQKITIKGLPYGITYKVTETNNKGYLTTYLVSKETPTSADDVLDDTNKANRKDVDESGSMTNAETLTDDTDNVTFVNWTTYELPETGGIGRLKYMLAGILLVMIAGFAYAIKRRKGSGGIL